MKALACGPSDASPCLLWRPRPDNDAQLGSRTESRCAVACCRSRRYAVTTLFSDDILTSARVARQSCWESSALLARRDWRWGLGCDQPRTLLACPAAPRHEEQFPSSATSHRALRFPRGTLSDPFFFSRIDLPPCTVSPLLRVRHMVLWRALFVSVSCVRFFSFCASCAQLKYVSVTLMAPAAILLPRDHHDQRPHQL